MRGVVSSARGGGLGGGWSGLAGNPGLCGAVLANAVDSGHHRVARLLDFVNFDLTIL